MEDKLHKVKTKGYRNRYYRVGNDIYTEAYLRHTFPDKWKIVEKELRFKKAKEKVVVSQFPNNKTMLKMLEEKAQEIMQKCNIKNIRHKDADVVTAALLTDYLVKNSNYNMTTIEDRLKPYKKFWNVIQNLDSKNGNHAKRLEKARYHYDQATLKSLFNHLIYKNGVCIDFSHTLSFLMNLKYDFSCFVLYTGARDDSIAHSVNLLRKEDKNKESLFYMIDVTLCLALHQNKNKDTLTYFMTPQLKVLSASMDSIGIVGNSQNTYLYHEKDTNKVLIGILSNTIAQEIHKNIQHNNPYLDAIEYARYMIEHDYEIPKQEKNLEKETTISLTK